MGQNVVGKLGIRSTGNLRQFLGVCSSKCLVELRLRFHHKKLTDDKILVQVFNRLDKDNSGALSPKEFKVLIKKSAKQNPSPDLMRGMWQAAQAMRQGQPCRSKRRNFVGYVAFFFNNQKLKKHFVLCFFIVKKSQLL